MAITAFDLTRLEAMIAVGCILQFGALSAREFQRGKGYIRGSQGYGR